MLSVGVLPARRGSKLGKTPTLLLVAQSAPGVQDSPAMRHRWSAAQLRCLDVSAATGERKGGVPALVMLLRELFWFMCGQIC
uniref:Uncharacterized protein n=1 Tax=Knipowitschia caucasica TaxID=637954 RepID=A0AAV2JWD0_KNICA